ncbi:MAG: hypothetical protein DRQ88_04885 [Epsilonproteobacteria bacterium]|nr:MAG: hypothetical protein DRQ89_08275 [Campylobacterota bacterium]RLA66870.1 MAG: hypothetical protein DRQ88_04885 [Campylobacterota bacterium]
MTKATTAKLEVENENVSFIWENVRKAQEIEALYRFIDEHSLRRESKIIFEALWSKLGPKKRSRRNSAKKVH